MTCTENKCQLIILRRDQSRVICHIGFLSIFQFETLQETYNLQARQCIFFLFFSKQFALIDFRTISGNTSYTTSKYALNDENYDDDSHHDQNDDGQ